MPLVGFWLLASGFWLLGRQVCSLPGIDGRQRDAGEQVSRPALEFASACTITVDLNCPLILVAIRVPCLSDGVGLLHFVWRWSAP